MLNEIITAKKRRLKEQKENIAFDVMKNRAALMPATRNFRQSLLGEKIKLIAEIKKASPSLGDINPNLDIKETAMVYEKSGASAISVLTEEDYFKGHPAYIAEVKETVKVPILRKDFIVDEYQIYESRVLGADALLLIATALEEDMLKKLVKLSSMLDVEPLVEVHDEADVEKTLKSGARTIGINNRNLKTFKTDISTTCKLISLIGKDKVVVSESGIKTEKDVEGLHKIGVDAVLIGESIVKADDIEQKIKSLMGNG